MAKAPVVKLDEVGHRYTVDGLPVSGVTSVINMIASWEGIAPEVLKKASERGTAVHLATELEDENDLDWDTLDPVLVPYVQAWQKFKSEAGVVITSSEQIVYSARHRYAGKYDRTCYLTGLHDEHCLIDIKTTAVLAPYNGIQTAAYEAAIDYRRTGLPRVKRRYAVQLKPDGKYQLEEYSDSYDKAVFLNLLGVHNWRRKHEKKYELKSS